ncbi:MAG: dethiobiotin synthase [Mariprofundaceae bacterium]
MTRKFFITATDTGAGKTFIAARLVKILLDRGVNALAVKPVACGTGKDGINEDVAILMQAQGISDPQQINLYSFAMPSAPSIAASAEGRKIDPERLGAWCEQQIRDVDICLIEGVGGLMVPLTEKFLVSDWLAGLPDAKTLLVAQARLGAINHTLLTLKQLQHIRHAPRWLAINCTENSTNSLASLHLAEALRTHLATSCEVVTISCVEKQGQDMANSLAYLADRMTAQTGE